MLLKEIVHCIETIAPLPLQESYDNAGLLTGHPNDEVSGALITLDVTEAVIDEAIKLGLNLIIAHHPIIFKPLKKINGNNEVERCIIKAIKNGIALYAAHTNLDNSSEGVNAILCRKLGLDNTSILSPIQGNLRKLVMFVPESYAEKVRQALFSAGAGHIGNYDSCSFNITGNGTFRALEGTNPFVGSMGEIHTEPEIRIETIVPAWLEAKALSAAKNVHPYEEVAWDSYPLNNQSQNTGAGMSGFYKNPVTETDFIQSIKTALNTPAIRCSPFSGRKINKVAVCGGSGNFLIHDALRAGADAFVTGELKYHDYFLAEGRILLVEAGHYETEQFTKELLYQIVKEKFPTFALQISMIDTNPVNYL
ncbi:MAG: Nif3-like dinuclear metal center hexameric protein [Lentimicrobium sp.]|nr:Nif3-like dinuclear metal center hexameric protein [Lentimicrobium sp.]